MYNYQKMYLLFKFIQESCLHYCAKSGNISILRKILENISKTESVPTIINKQSNVSIQYIFAKLAILARLFSEYELAKNFRMYVYGKITPYA